MATYRELHGKAVKTVTTNPSDDAAEGQIWFNSTDNTFKSVVALEAVSSSSPLSTGRNDLTSAQNGTMTAGLVFGGVSPPGSATGESEEWNGLGWSTGGTMSTVRYNRIGFGIQTAAVATTGQAPNTNATEHYNGSAWSSATAYPGSIHSGAGCGTQTAGLAFAGRNPSPAVQASTFEYDGSSWSSGGDLSTARQNPGGCGIQTAGLTFGGRNSPSDNFTSTEEYGGTSWTSGGAMNTGRVRLASGGTQTSAIALGGEVQPGSQQTAIENYDGTSWTTSPASLGTSRYALAGFGTGANSLGCGGYAPGRSALVEEYNKSVNVITAGAWSTGANLPTAIFTQAAGGTKTAALVFGGRYLPTVDQNATYEGDGSSWSSGGNLAQARRSLNGCGSQTAGLAVGGHYSSPSTEYKVAEHYNGTAWTAGGTFNAPGHPGGSDGATGTQTAAVVAGGYPAITQIENYNGSAWTTAANFPTGRSTNAFGSQTAAVFAGGYTTTSVATVDEYDGSSLSSGGSLPFANSSMGTSSQAPATAAIIFGGSESSTDKETFYYDGTSWSTRPSLGTGRFSGGASGAVGTSFLAGGYTTTTVVSTEEFTDESTSINVKTLTQS